MEANTGVSNYNNYQLNKRERRGKRANLPDEIAKKLKSCSVPDCEDWRDLTLRTTYHCFPIGENNQDRWEIWTALVRRARNDADWLPFRGSLICSHHFRPQDFVNDPSQKRTKLIKKAIPSIFPNFTVDVETPGSQYYFDNEGTGDASIENGSYDYSYDGYEQEEQEETNASAEYEEEEVQYLDSSNSGMNSLRQTHDIFLIGKDEQEFEDNNEFEEPEHINIKSEQVDIEEIFIYDGDEDETAPTTSVQSHLAYNKRGRQSYPNPTKSTEAEKSLHLPYSINPDLEIALVDPEPDDAHALCHRRVQELEQENESLKSKNNSYENTIRILQRKLKEHTEVINAYKQAHNPKRKRV